MTSITITLLSGGTITVDVDDGELVETLKRKVEERLGLGDDVCIQLVKEGHGQEVLREGEPVVDSILYAIAQPRLRVAVVGTKEGQLKDPKRPRSRKNKPEPSTRFFSMIDMTRGSTMREFDYDFDFLALLADGSLACLCRSSSQLTILDHSTGYQLRTVPTQHENIGSYLDGYDNITCLTAFKDGFATGADNGDIHVVGADGGCQSLTGHVCRISSLAPIEGHLASGCFGSQIRVWDVCAPAYVLTLEDDGGGHVVGLCAVGENTLVSCSDMDPDVKVWDVRMGECVRVFGGHGDGPGTGSGCWDVCAMDEGFATIDANQQVRVWDMKASQPKSSMRHSAGGDNNGFNHGRIAYSDGVIFSMGGCVVRSWSITAGSEGEGLNVFQPTTHSLQDFVVL